MVFSGFTDIYNYYHNQFYNIFITSTRSPRLLNYHHSTSFILTPLATVTTQFLSFLMNFEIWVWVNLIILEGNG